MEQNKTIGDKVYDVVFRADNEIDRTILKTLGNMWVDDSTNLEKRNLRIGYSDDYGYMDFKNAVLQFLGAIRMGTHVEDSRYAGSNHCVHLDFDYMGNAQWSETMFRVVSGIGIGIDSVEHHTTDESVREAGGYVCCEDRGINQGRDHWVCVWVPFDEIIYQQELREAAEERVQAAALNKKTSVLNVESQKNNNEVAEMKVDESAFNLVSGTTTTVTYVIIAMVIVAALTGLFFMFK